MVPLQIGKEEFIYTDIANPLIKGLKSTLSSMCGVNGTVGAPKLSTPSKIPRHDIILICGFFSSNFVGNVTLGFKEETFLFVMSKLLGKRQIKVVPELHDGLAEIFNMILGEAKKHALDKNLVQSMAIPTIIGGHSLWVSYSTTGHSYSIPFLFGNGEINLEITAQQMEKDNN